MINQESSSGKALEKREVVYNAKNRTDSSLLNITMNFLNKIVGMVLSFVGRAVFIQVLSVEYLGINGLFSDILSMLSLADLGLGTAMAYSFYKPLAERDERKLSALIGFYRRIYLIIALVVGILGLALLPFLPLIVNTDQEIPYIHIYYLLALSNTVISYLFVYKASIIAADQRGYIVTKYSIWINLAKTALQILVLYYTHNFFAYLLLNTATTVAYNLLVSWQANKAYPFINQREELQKEEKADIFSNIKAVVLYKIAMVITGSTDNIIISVLIGTAMVGIYSNYYSITSGTLGAFIGIIFGSLTASVGNMVVKETPQKRYEVFRILQSVSFFLSGLVTVCLFFLTDDFITMWIGSEYLLDRYALVAIIANFYLTITCQPIWSFREATGLYQKLKYILFLTAAVNIALSIPLGMYFGVAGIIGATAISRLSTYFWYEPSLLYREFFQLDVRSYYKEHLLNAGLILASALIASAMAVWMPGANVLFWLVKAAFCTGAVCGVYWIRYRKTWEYNEVISRVKSILSKKR